MARRRKFLFTYRPGRDDDRVEKAFRTHRGRIELVPVGLQRRHKWKYDNKHQPELRAEDAREVHVYLK